MCGTIGCLQAGHAGRLSDTRAKRNRDTSNLRRKVAPSPPVRSTSFLFCNFPWCLAFYRGSVRTRANRCSTLSFFLRRPDHTRLANCGSILRRFWLCGHSFQFKRHRCSPGKSVSTQARMAARAFFPPPTARPSCNRRLAHALGGHDLVFEVAMNALPKQAYPQPHAFGWPARCLHYLGDVLHRASLRSAKNAVASNLHMRHPPGANQPYVGFARVASPTIPSLCSAQSSMDKPLLPRSSRRRPVDGIGFARDHFRGPLR